MNYLLDTCVLSELVKPKPAARVVEWVRGRTESSFFLSVITLGEIRRGIEKLPSGKKRAGLQRWLEQDLTGRFWGRLLDVNVAIAEQWGILSANAEQRGRTLPVIDGLLAATAQVAHLTLVTRNTDDFRATHVSLFDPWAL